MDIKKTSSILGQMKQFTAQQGKQKDKTQTIEMTQASLQTSRFAQFRLETQQESATSFEAQNGLSHLINQTDFDISQLQYNNKSILELSPEEATKLVSQDGYWGIDKTSQRLADFVLNGSGGDLNKLRAGREGILQGFKEAEKLWGGKLPDISYKTIDQALSNIDDKIKELGGAVVDTTA
ncbi:MAG: hydrogenase-4 component G [Proteobacteria bacterium]|nr:hydrogenase-4 component G [Pseudomonadota bacterium]MBU4294676.1 hydrogenase-4 component G [Pseudomonadota bacterium]MCG2748856.1 hydrogenase-4 component G [Desulfobulbaceae bacterium]